MSEMDVFDSNYKKIEEVKVKISNSYLLILDVLSTQYPYNQDYLKNLHESLCLLVDIKNKLD